LFTFVLDYRAQITDTRTMLVTTGHNTSQVIGVQEVAKALSLHPQTIREMASAGEIPGAKRRGTRGKWLFPATAPADYLEQNSPHRTQTSSSGASTDGAPSGPDRQDGDQPAGMPAGSFDSNPGQPAQEA
jgi:excisionase family DNA binding protein